MGGAPVRRNEQAGPRISIAASARICALCGREAKGLGYVHHLRLGRYPHHRFCSACFELGCALARKGNGMINTTAMEARAIQDARRALAAVLTELSLMDAFRRCSAAEIDRLIGACVGGYQASMRRQAAEGSTTGNRVAADP
jgi:hypothetical protein